MRLEWCRQQLYHRINWTAYISFRIRKVWSGVYSLNFSHKILIKSLLQSKTLMLMKKTYLSNLMERLSCSRLMCKEFHSEWLQLSIQNNFHIWNHTSLSRSMFSAKIVKNFVQTTFGSPETMLKNKKTLFCKPSRWLSQQR